jgi:DNA-binding NtrC family response regulator
MLREQVPEANVIFMSAYPAEVLVQEGLRDLRVQFLAKPFTREELLTAVAKRPPSRKESHEKPHQADRPGNQL